MNETNEQFKNINMCLKCTPAQENYMKVLLKSMCLLNF